MRCKEHCEEDEATYESLLEKKTDEWLCLQ